MTLCLRPITMQDAKSYIARWHRHNIPPVSGLFAAAVEVDGEIVGVATVGRPTARMLQDGWTAEITRAATDLTKNANSKLYGACLRACRALGYRRVFTYTLKEETGASLRAVGFVVDAELPARKTWSCPSRPRTQTDLFGNERRPAGPKLRWVKMFGAPS